MGKKHIVGILWEQANDTWFSKDMCAYPYYLADKYDWNATLCYFAEHESLMNLEYQKKVSLVNLGCETNYQKKVVWSFIFKRNKTNKITEKALTKRVNNICLTQFD